MADWRDNLIDNDERIRAILTKTRTIAVVGMKADPAAVSHRIPSYMHKHGYQIFPINPKLDEALGGPAHDRLADITEPIDMINLFRASQFIAGHAEETLAMEPQPRFFWTQSGIRDDAAAEALAKAGIQVIQDRCLYVEHGRAFE